MFLCLIVIWGFGVSTCFSDNSIEDLRKAAEQGDAEAQFKLGCSYYSGDGVPQNLAEAVIWYRKSAEKGHSGAQLNLGSVLKDGEGVPKDEVEAMKWFLKSAGQGDKAAQHSVGILYYFGNGVAQDYSEAAIWFLKAAEQGFAPAQHNLGYMYKTGSGVPRSLPEAMKWTLKAAYQGWLDAQSNAGIMYANGEGAPKDEIEALAWLFIATASGKQNGTNTRVWLENRLDRQSNLLAQQRSKEILSKIESAKQSNRRDSDPTDKQPTHAIKATGSGVFVTNDGLILTAAHVVGNSSIIKAVTKNGLITTRIIRLDRVNDLALLKCEGRFRGMPIKSSSSVKLGQLVFTVGFPNVGFQGFSPKMTRGEISSLSGFQDDPRHWQISVPVQPGNSGGPLFDEAGNIVGLVSAKLDALKIAEVTGDLSQNVNYAIKSTYALPLLEGHTLSEPFPSQSSRKLEAIVEKVQDAVVLILVY